MHLSINLKDESELRAALKSLARDAFNAIAREDLTTWIKEEVARKLVAFTPDVAARVAARVLDEPTVFVKPGAYEGNRAPKYTHKEWLMEHAQRTVEKKIKEAFELGSLEALTKTGVEELVIREVERRMVKLAREDIRTIANTEVRAALVRMGNA